MIDMNYQTTATIRQRGQLTIPEDARKFFEWLNMDKIVTIQLSSEAMTIKPYVKTVSDNTRWKRADELMQIAHSFTGGKGNGSSLIAQDRENGHYD